MVNRKVVCIAKYLAPSDLRRIQVAERLKYAREIMERARARESERHHLPVAR